MLTTDIKIQPSKFFSGLTLAVIMTTMIIISTLPLSLAVKLVLVLLTFGYGFRIFHHDCLMKSKSSIHNLYLNNDGWWLATNTAVAPARICGDSTLSAFVSVLRFKIEGCKRKHSLVLFRDAVSTDAYRRLLVTLRTGVGITAQ